MIIDYHEALPELTEFLDCFFLGGNSFDVDHERTRSRIKYAIEDYVIENLNLPYNIINIAERHEILTHNNLKRLKDQVCSICLGEFKMD